MNTNNTTKNTNIPTTANRFAYGTKKTETIKRLENFQFPNEPFTMAQIIEKFGFSHEIFLSHLKSHAKVVGEAPKRSGARGPAAKLYQYVK
jgi:hypothetical protein